MLCKLFAIAVIATVAPLASAQDTSLVRTLLAATIEQEATMHAGRACNFVSESEWNYWYKQWNFASSSLLGEAAQGVFNNERYSTANMNRLEAKVAQYAKGGCSDPTFIKNISDLKNTLRVNGLGLKQLDETYARALQDLYKGPKPE